MIWKRSVSLLDYKTKILILNLFLFTIPISFILGNLVLNLNIIVLIIISLFFLKLDIFRLKLNIIDKLVIIFFSYILINGFYNNFFNFNYPKVEDQHIVLIKSSTFLRYLLLYFVLRYLVFKNLINFKLLFLIYSFVCLFVSIDVIIQFIFGRDLFGFEASGRRMPGPFNDEAIAGSFIQRFFIFVPYFVLIFSNQQKSTKSTLIFACIIISLIGVALAGNRISLVMLILILGIIFLFEKELKKILIMISIISIAAVIYVFKEPNEFRHHYKNFASDAVEIINYSKAKILNKEINNTNVHIKEIESGFLTWEENKIIGGGVKSFRWVCSNIDRSKALKIVSKRGGLNCNNHPHNYYIQLAAELGLVGILIFIVLLISLISKSIIKLNYFKNDTVSYKLLLVFFILFICEVFPLKTTGSFFTTFNSSYIFLILPFISGLLDQKRK